MNILCTLFGHQSHPHRYMKVAPFAIDGIGTEHAQVNAECRRCETSFVVGKIHLPPRLREQYLKTSLDRARIDLAEAREQLAVITHGAM